MKRTLGFCLACTTLSAAALAAGPEQIVNTRRAVSSYSVRAIAVPDGFSNAGANGVNTAGELAGSASGPNGSMPIINIAGASLLLDSLGGLQNYANDINEAGQVVGTSQSQPWWGNKAVRWNVDGTMTVIMPITGDENGNSYGNGINNLGHIAGQADVNNGMWHAFVWSKETGTIDLGTLGGSYSAANDVNDHGVAVGWSWTNIGTETAFVTVDGVMQALPSFQGGEIVGGMANAINNNGVIVGFSNGEQYGIQRAAMWDEKGDIHDLGTLGGHSSWANDINNAGVIVGEALLKDGTRHAFIFENGTMRDLNDLLPAGSGWVLERALAISENGRIVGYGTHHGAGASFVLSPKRSGRVQSK